MLYEHKSFTLPAAGPHCGQERWDFAFLTREEFARKYGLARWHELAD